jgi:3-oxoacyl-[acyl-carrier-protein] synthase-3
LDIPSGCTGYLHGLFVSSSLIASTSCRKVLLLCGETNSKLINEKDKSVSMIFGDAGSATVLGFRSHTDSFFSFRTDGSGYENIIIRDGGCRNGFSMDSLTMVEYENDNFRHSLNMKMDGMSVFNFAITAVPTLVRESLSDCSLSPESVDLFAVHQANQLIVNQLAKKCGL